MAGPTFPSRDKVTDKSGYVTQPWQIWLRNLSTSASATVQTVQTVSLAAQGAAIGATSFKTPLVTGLYTVTWYLRIVRAATTSSSLQVQVGFTDESIPCVMTGAAVTGNTIATVQSGTFIVRCDRGAPVTYSTIYSSAGATTMQYDLVLTFASGG